MELLGGVFLTGVLTVGIAGGIGYGIFRLISPKGPVDTPTKMGRKWFALVAFITTLTSLPNFLRTFDVDPFGVWIVGIMVVGGFAFVGGWLYGKISDLKGPAPSAPSSAPSQLSAFSHTREQSAMAHESIPTSARAGLEQLNELHQNGLITQTEYDQQRARILSEL